MSDTLKHKLPLVLSSSVLLIVFIISIVAIHHTRNTQKTPSHINVTTMVRTDDGFFPSDVTISKGTTLVFTSESTTHHWPASDLHPSHGVYPAFDPKRALTPDESWQFTFDEVGEWEFHDHLQPHFGGVIRVTQFENEAPPEPCEFNTHKKACWNNLLRETLESRGLDASLTLLQTLHSTNEHFATQCHLLAHDLGVKTYRIYKEDVAFSPKTAYCNGGFYHGYMEGYVDNNFTPEQLDAFCTSIGTTLNAHYPNAENQCRHGIGHGAEELTIRLHPHLWEQPTKLIEEGLRVCEATNHTYDQNMRCASGVMSVFADWALSTPQFEHYLTDDLFFICKAQTKRHAKDACYWEFAKKAVDVLEEDIEASFQLLAQSFPKDIEQEYKHRAVRSLSIRHGYASADTPNEEAVAVCRQLPHADQRHCIVGTVEGLLLGSDPGQEILRSASFCNNSTLHEEEVAPCFHMIEDRIFQSYIPFSAEVMCTYVPKRFQRTGLCAS